MSTSAFSDNDAKALVTIANRAPLQNMQEAVVVSQLLQRFTEWHAAVTTPPEPEQAEK